MKPKNAKFAIIIAEKTQESAMVYTAGIKSPWDRLLAIVEPTQKHAEYATKLGESAWNIDLTRGLHILAAILHHASTERLKVHVLFSTRRIEWLTIPAQASLEANQTQT